MKIKFRFTFFCNKTISELWNLFNELFENKVTTDYSFFQRNEVYSYFEVNDGFKDLLVSVETKFYDSNEVENTVSKILDCVKQTGHTKFLNVFDICLFLKNNEQPSYKILSNIDVKELRKRFPENLFSKDNDLFYLDKRTKTADSGLIQKTGIEIPKKEFYLVDFSNYSFKKEVWIKFINGEGYEKEKDKVIETVLELVQSLETIKYGKKQKENLVYLLEKSLKKTSVYRGYVDFKNTFKNLEFFVDLKSDESYIQFYWNHIKDGLFSLIVDGLFTEEEMKLNYDTARSCFQIADARLSHVVLNKLDVVNCEFENSVLNGCFVVGMEGNECILYNTYLKHDCHLKNSIFETCRFEDESILIEDSVIFGMFNFLNCVVKDSQVNDYLRSFRGNNFRVEGSTKTNNFRGY